MKQQQKNSRFVAWLLLGVFVMFGFSFALIPLYNVLCDALGVNGKTGNAVSQQVLPKVVDKSRWVTIEFVATNNENLPWSFYPKTKKARIHPGESIKIAYFAKNNTANKMIVQAIPSVTPGLAAKYVKKTECFCFRQQTLAGKQSKDMPLIFYLDPDLPKRINTITLSYTLFDVSNHKPTQSKKINRLPG